MTQAGQERRFGCVGFFRRRLGSLQFLVLEGKLFLALQQCGIGLLPLFIGAC